MGTPDGSDCSNGRPKNATARIPVLFVPICRWVPHCTSPYNGNPAGITRKAGYSGSRGGQVPRSAVCILVCAHVAEDTGWRNAPPCEESASGAHNPPPETPRCGRCGGFPAWRFLLPLRYGGDRCAKLRDPRNARGRGRNIQQPSAGGETYRIVGYSTGWSRVTSGRLPDVVLRNPTPAHGARPFRRGVDQSSEVMMVSGELRPGQIQAKLEAVSAQFREGSPN